MTNNPLFPFPVIQQKLHQFRTKQYSLLCHFMPSWLPILLKIGVFTPFFRSCQHIWIRFYILILKRYGEKCIFKRMTPELQGTSISFNISTTIYFLYLNFFNCFAPLGVIHLSEEFCIIEVFLSEIHFLDNIL